MIRDCIVQVAFHDGTSIDVFSQNILPGCYIKIKLDFKNRTRKCFKIHFISVFIVYNELKKKFGMK
jgi:hypothetical protein